MIKINAKSTRVDLRIPNELYKLLVDIAVQNDAPINPRTGKVVITNTIVSLLQLGIESAKEKGYYSD
jgi:hypothetical protein